MQHLLSNVTQNCNCFWDTLASSIIHLQSSYCHHNWANKFCNQSQKNWIVRYSLTCRLQAILERKRERERKRDEDWWNFIHLAIQRSQKPVIEYNFIPVCSDLIMQIQFITSSIASVIKTSSCFYRYKLTLNAFMQILIQLWL